jgi:hypothetical protein
MIIIVLSVFIVVVRFHRNLSEVEIKVVVVIIMITVVVMIIAVAVVVIFWVVTAKISIVSHQKVELVNASQICLLVMRGNVVAWFV